MEKQTARIVNIGLAGQPEHAVLQITENLKCVQFSEIKYVSENEGAIHKTSFIS